MGASSPHLKLGTSIATRFGWRALNFAAPDRESGPLAAMLAVTGIFGMAAYNVNRRMKELGIRVALGARRLQLMNAAIGRPIVLLCAG
jgi:hypothetical protein